MKKIGFTLIELLVVILIIGILAAIAMPQYQKAVEKSRAMEAVAVLKYLGEAQELFYLREGSYANTLEPLEVSLPSDWKPSQSCHNNSTMTICVANENWAIGWTGNNSYNWRMFDAIRLKGYYASKLRFAYVFIDDGNPQHFVPKRQVLCISTAYCPELFSGKHVGNFGIAASNVYSLQ